MTLRKSALIAGIFYFIAIWATPYSWINPLIIIGDAANTYNNILSNEFVFRLAIICWFIVLVADTIVGWALYHFFVNVNRSISLLAFVFRIVFAPIMALAVFQWVKALQLISTSAQIDGEKLNVLQEDIMFYFVGYEYAVNIAFMVFGIHVAIIGYLVYKSKLIPRLLGIFLMVAGLGYQIDCYASLLFPEYVSYPYGFYFTIAIPAFCSEFILTLWLLIKGARLKSD